MEVYNFMDRASSMVIVGLTCYALMSANTSTGIDSFEVPKSTYNLTAYEFGNESNVLAEYKIPKSKLSVENEAQYLFGKMREATFSEQKCIQDHIDKIAVPTGVSFWS